MNLDVFCSRRKGSAQHCLRVDHSLPDGKLSNNTVSDKLICRAARVVQGVAQLKNTLWLFMWGAMSQKELRKRLEGTVLVQHQQLKMGFLADLRRACGKTCLTDQKK